MECSTHMDKTNIKIIKALEQNSRLSTNDIWKITGIPQTTAYNRIKKLKEEGIIEKFTIKLNKKKIGKGLAAYILCTVSYRTTKGEKLSQINVAKGVKAMSEVEDVSIVTGELDLIVKVAVEDVDTLNDFIVNKLRDVEGIEKTVTCVVLSEV